MPIVVSSEIQNERARFRSRDAGGDQAPFGFLGVRENVIPMLGLPIKDRQQTDAAGPAAAEAWRLNPCSLQGLQQRLALANLDGLLRLRQTDDERRTTARGAEALLMDSRLREAELPSCARDGAHQALGSAGVDMRPERLVRENIVERRPRWSAMHSHVLARIVE